MPQVALTIGCAGSGKTTYLLDLMDKVIDSGVDPREIGFVSFTRAARSEAANRAASRFNVKPSDLERQGWFRTLHSVCYRQLAVGDELLVPSKKTSEWLKNALQEEVGGTGEKNPEDDFESVEERSMADTALSLWSKARNRLVPLSEVHAREIQCDPHATPKLDFCKRIIERYEQQKRLDHRCDFTDLLGRFSGWGFTVNGHVAGYREGEVPDVPVWFLDEAQDNSALTDAVARRLAEKAKWVYLVGDPFQAIFSFSGADPSLFQKWDAVKRRTLSKSYRCPAEIVQLGEECIRHCSDYFDRGVEAADHEGQIDDLIYDSNWPADVDPNDSWLLLARTNFVARRLSQRLNGWGIPWVPTKGKGGWAESKRTNAASALLWLERGGEVNEAEWSAVLDQIRSKEGGVELLQHGAKAAWERRAGGEEARGLPAIGDWGATEEFRNAIQRGQWAAWVERGAEFRAAVDRWGWKGAQESKVRIGTIHSAKGMEADNVLVLTTTSHQVDNSMQDEIGADEERRLAYVAVTRARKRLIVAKERVRFCMEIPL